MNEIIYSTPTGYIFSDTEDKLEWLIVGDYGKENNLKANFLGLTKPIMGVQHKEVDLTEKAVVTISTQRGCPMKCLFCDVPKVGYHGNVSSSDLIKQVLSAISFAKGKEMFSIPNYTKRLNIHFARMGEPMFNMSNILVASILIPGDVERIGLKADTVHPVVSTMLPKNISDTLEWLRAWCDFKNWRKGEAGLQLSINSTDDEQRNYQFKDMAMELKDIAKLAEKLPMPLGRKYTLNFAITEQTILDAKKLSSLFDKEKFIVKITPIHETKSAVANKFDVTSTYVDYNVYEKYEGPLLEEGWDVIVFVPSREEDLFRITCGNTLLRKE